MAATGPLMPAALIVLGSVNAWIGLRQHDALVHAVALVASAFVVEVGLVLVFFVTKYEAYYAIVTLVALLTYIVFTVKVTEWRTHFRRTMNELD